MQADGRASQGGAKRGQQWGAAYRSTDVKGNTPMCNATRLPHAAAPGLTTPSRRVDGELPRCHRKDGRGRHANRFLCLPRRRCRLASPPGHRAPLGRLGPPHQQAAPASKPDRSPTSACTVTWPANRGDSVEEGKQGAPHPTRAFACSTVQVDASWCSLRNMAFTVPFRRSSQAAGQGWLERRAGVQAGCRRSDASAAAGACTC